jgi:hypothetical protein
MATDRRREEIDAEFAAWERDLERLRVALANAPEAVNAKHHDAFVKLYRQKEIAKSAWEAIRGVYRPDAEAVRCCDGALATMETAWAKAEPLLAELLPVRAADRDPSRSNI